MLLIAVTRTPVDTEPSVPVVYSAACGAFRVTIASAFGGEVVEDADGVTLEGRPRREDRCVLRQSLFSISFRRRDTRLRIEKSPLFGLPVYFLVNNKGEFFASTHIALLRKAGNVIEENSAALPEFFLYRCVMPPRTLFRGIERLFHGGALDISVADDNCSLARHVPAAWLRGSVRPDAAIPFEEHVAALVARLDESFARLETERDSVALLLSGGIDSTTTSLLARNRLGADRSFSTAYPFELPERDMEKRYALSAAEALGFRHHHYVGTNPGYRRALVSSIAGAEEPVDHLQVPCFDMLLEKGMDPRFGAVVQGLGAGGCFGNFRNHLFLLNKPFFHLLSRQPFVFAVEAAARLTRSGRTLSGKLRDMRIDAPPDSPRNPLWAWHCYGDIEWVCERFGTNLADIVRPQWDVVSSTSPETVYDLWARYSLLGDEDAILSINAKITSARGRYLHSPFYEPRVLQAALSVPWPEKMKFPENRLRKAMAARAGVPAFVLSRPKTGFGIKRSDWALEGGVFEPFVGLAAEIFGHAEVRAMQALESPKAMTFWGMINYAVWRRLVIDGDSADNILGELEESGQRAKANE